MILHPKRHLFFPTECWIPFPLQGQRRLSKLSKFHLNNKRDEQLKLDNIEDSLMKKLIPLQACLDLHLLYDGIDLIVNNLLLPGVIPFMNQNIIKPQHLSFKQWKETLNGECIVIIIAGIWVSWVGMLDYLFIW